MWNYDKILEFPVNIKRPNAKAAQVILSQYGGPDGELGASLRYLSQKFSMPNRRVAGLLNDIGISLISWPYGKALLFPKSRAHIIDFSTLPK